jgi:hypothetical protein
MYHFFLSGDAVFAADRLYGERMLEAAPGADVLAHHNRRFLRRAVEYIAGRGVIQFLDIGSGLPTVGNTHEVAGQVHPGCRVVYADIDVEAVNRSHALLDDQNVLGTTAVIEGDLREPDLILDHPETRRLIDLREPVGLLIVAVWHFVADADHPREVMALLRDRLPTGSYVAMSHASQADVDDVTACQAAEFTSEYNTLVTDRLTLRDRTGFTALFDGFQLVEPGIVYPPDWRPDGPVDETDPMRRAGYAGVGVLHRDDTTRPSRSAGLVEANR